MRRRPILLSILMVLLATGGCSAAGREADATRSAPLQSGQALVSGSQATFTLSSPAVSNGQLLPEYRCEPKVDGVEASIPLAWSGIPDGTGSLHDTVLALRGRGVAVGSLHLCWGFACGR